MNATCQLFTRTRSMLAKIPLILTLVVSLLFATQAQPAVFPVEMKQGGTCAGMECAPGCCANMACCTNPERQQTPPPSAPAPQRTDVSLAILGLRAYTILFPPPVPRHAFVILDEASTAHTLSPLAVSCIRLL